MSRLHRVLVTTAGAGSWTPPPGVRQILVRFAGGAGGGGGGSGSGAGTAQNSGGGGGGGSLVHERWCAVTPNSAINYVVGAGGTGGAGGAIGTAGTDGSNGGTTTFASTVPLQALGAEGGCGGNHQTGVAYSGGGKSLSRSWPSTVEKHGALDRADIALTPTAGPPEPGQGGYGRFTGGGALPHWRHGGSSCVRLGGTGATDAGVANAGGSGGGGGAGEYDDGVYAAYNGGAPQQTASTAGNPGNGSNTTLNYPTMGGGGGSGAMANNAIGGAGGNGGSGFIEILWWQ